MMVHPGGPCSRIVERHPAEATRRSLLTQKGMGDYSESLSPFSNAEAATSRAVSRPSSRSLLEKWTASISGGTPMRSKISYEGTRTPARIPHASRVPRVARLRTPYGAIGDCTAERAERIHMNVDPTKLESSFDLEVHLSRRSFRLPMCS